MPLDRTAGMKGAACIETSQCACGRSAANRSAGGERSVKAGAVLFCFLLLCTMPLRAESVFQKDGNIFLALADGQTRQVTSSGKDFSPDLSPDGKLVVFIRDTPERLVEVFGLDAHANELWVVDIEGKRPRLMLSGGRLKRRTFQAGYPVAPMATPQFSLDGRDVYFVSAGGATDAPVLKVNLTTGRVTEIAWGHTLKVLREGASRGCLVVDQHKYFLQGGSYDWYWLLSPNGKEIGPIGDGTQQVQLFRDTSEEIDYCRPAAELTAQPRKRPHH